MSSSSSGPPGSRSDGRSGRHASGRSNDVEPRGEHRCDRGHRSDAEDGPKWSCDRDAAPAPDLVERLFSATCPDVLSVVDITYVPTWQGFLYAAVVLDAFSRAVVGWSMAGHLRTELILDALDMAISRRRTAEGLIHHSDQGTQGGLNQSSQHCLVPSSVGVRPVHEQRLRPALSGGRHRPFDGLHRGMLR